MSNKRRIFQVHNSGLDLGDSLVSVGIVEGEGRVFLELDFKADHEIRIEMDAKAADMLSGALSVSAMHAKDNAG